jgi:hypothetical protein
MGFSSVGTAPELETDDRGRLRGAVELLAAWLIAIPTSRAMLHLMSLPTGLNGRPIDCSWMQQRPATTRRPVIEARWLIHHPE